MNTRVAIVGAAGRMGRMLVKVVNETEGLMVTVATDRQESKVLGMDAGILAGIGEIGVNLVEDLAEVVDDFDVVIDFTAPVATLNHTKICAEHGKAIAIGTTGLTDDDKTALKAYAQNAKVMLAPNMSVGINVLANLVRQTARILGDDFDIEIVEMHHRHKVDAPSGTALQLGEAAAEGVQRNLKDVAIYGREGQEGPRSKETIGFSTLRGGDVIGDHTVVYAGDGERIELTHKATSRETFARGAARACLWLSGQSAGFYSMHDVLGLDQ